jgi:hypothetical protein
MKCPQCNSCMKMVYHHNSNYYWCWLCHKIYLILPGSTLSENVNNKETIIQELGL